MMCVLVLTILVSVYVGNVLGCLVLCETIPELSKAKKFVWQVPLINFSYVMYILFSSQKKGDRFQSLISYLKTPCKNVIANYAMAEAVKESVAAKKKCNSRQSSTHIVRLVFKSSVKGYVRAVVAGAFYL